MGTVRALAWIVGSIVGAILGLFNMWTSIGRGWTRAGAHANPKHGVNN